MGLSLAGQRDILLFVVESHRGWEIFENFTTVSGFDERSGLSMAFQIDTDNAVCLSRQVAEI